MIKNAELQIILKNSGGKPLNRLNGILPERVFYYFEEICNIPHGSGNTAKIAEYCVNFAKKYNLKFVKDDANNVVIYKNGSKGYEDSDTLILQGHIDMVCQKTPDSIINFETDGLDIYVDGDFVKAKGTTLGADNGIAVAMVLAILENDEIAHPPLEAVFTSDEEIGMVGALKLDTSLLNGNRMINLDVGCNREAIISCAGGSDVLIKIPAVRKIVCGKKITIAIKGLKGGHSGGAINCGRVNANILAGRFLNYINKISDFEIVEINGGDKGNVIPSLCEFSIIVSESEKVVSDIEDYYEVVKSEIADREEDFEVTIQVDQEDNYSVLENDVKEKLVYLLNSVPNGVLDMSTKILNLVETSLNFGVLKTNDKEIEFLHTLRSSKQTALDYLEERICNFYAYNDCTVETSGHYPPWEYKECSEIREKYLECYKEVFSDEPGIYAVHAGLECGVFASKIKDFDCISIGPDMQDIHTVGEKLSISGTKSFFEFLLSFIKKLK